MRRKFKRERGPRNWRECFWASLNETWDESWRRHAVKRKEFWPARMLIENYPAERGNCAEERGQAGIQSWGGRRGSSDGLDKSRDISSIGPGEKEDCMGTAAVGEKMWGGTPWKFFSGSFYFSV